MKPSILRIIIYVFLGLNALFIVGWWLIYSGLPATTISAKLIAIGRLTGLIAAFCALIELFLMSRLPSVERAFGLEQLVNFHRWNGQVVFYSFILHPILLSFGYQVDGKPNVFAQFVVFLQTYPDMIKALIGSILFLAVGGLSYSLIRKRITYEAWYIIHLTAYVAIVLAFFHQLSTGGDFIGHKNFSLYWVVSIIATFALILVYRLFSPVFILWYNKPHVSRIEAESAGVFSVYIAGQHFDSLKIRSGQYFGFQFLGNMLWGQVHPFTISKAPTNNELRITFKIYGGYTARLSKIKPGTKVLLDGPRGNSTWERSRLPRTLMIAGGIGITPMRALIESASEGQDIILLYACNNPSEAPLLDELKIVPTKAKLKIVPLFSNTDGRLTPELIQKHVLDVASREVYLCGPDPMVKGLTSYLKSIKIADENIHTERFSY